MTCEIAVMNKQAVVLAADSATTVRQWVDGTQEERYFKGANKIFQLSHSHAVGLMIYGTAALHKVPWEILVKDFRDSLGNKAFNSLRAYADELFQYAVDHPHLFPPEYQTRIFIDEVNRVVSIYLFLLAPQQSEIGKATTREDRTVAYNDYFANTLEPLSKNDFPEQIDEELFNKTFSSNKDELCRRASEAVVTSQIDAAIEVGPLVELAANSLAKQYSRFMDETGVVIAGYGDHDYLPRLYHLSCYGMLFGKILFDEKSSIGIDHDEAMAHIEPFATTSMVETFSLGVSPDIYQSVREEFKRTLLEYGKAIAQELGGSDEIPNEDALVSDACNQFMENWGTTALQAHAWPLNRVISSLPVDEMAELAETLIMLQSLKEKVTKPTESVGGPIDVAVISKTDGFVWIRRKHYFDPDLNPRFFQRQPQGSK